MPVTIQPSLDEPVVIFTYTDSLDSETVEQSNTRTGELLNEFGTFYAILDVGGLSAPVTPAVSAQLTVLHDARIHAVLVGEPKLPLADNIAVLPDTQTAMDYVRQQIAGRAPG